ncbi:E3 ubiquitin-protein ligase AIRP2 [Sesamum alatum]|uniref:E3 ubiquitin-protein ligase AIRP2 n=1 Tax=Sesamum alatum TaxID=300844 RepID=A0AAE1XMM4_9LAMI|nr:E3 ubiquitin-protein ligase AIRP2 [Sesamum alatum]
MDCCQLEKAPSCQDSLRAIESDIQHANMLAASISRAKGGACLQMKLAYNHLAPVYLFLLQWFNFSCTCLLPTYLNLFYVVIYKVHLDSKQKYPSHGRKATIGQFYAVILPSLEHLYDTSLELDTYQNELHGHDTAVRKKPEDSNKHFDVDLEREDECGICLDRCTKMVLPNCCHAMCINCYRDWNMRSESCPFCRGSLKRVKSGDLWVLTRTGDVVDQETLSKEDMFRFYLYINNLPKDTPDALFLVYYEYLI